jgi:hypothetical protein
MVAAYADITRPVRESCSQNPSSGLATPGSNMREYGTVSVVFARGIYT